MSLYLLISIIGWAQEKLTFVEFESRLKLFETAWIQSVPRIRFPLWFRYVAAHAPRRPYLTLERDIQFNAALELVMHRLKFITLDAFSPSFPRSDATYDGLHFHTWGSARVSNMVTVMLQNIICNNPAENKAAW